MNSVSDDKIAPDHQAHHHFHHSSRVITPRYTTRSGFIFQGIKPIVEDGPEYMALPELDAKFKHPPENIQRNLREAKLKAFLGRNKIISALTYTITQLYFRYSDMHPHRHPTEFFVEHLVGLHSHDTDIDDLDAEIDGLAEELGHLRNECTQLQRKLKTWNAESIQIYNDYLSNDEQSESDDSAPIIPLSRPNTPASGLPQRSTFLDRWEVESKSSSPSADLPSQTIRREVSFSLNMSPQKLPVSATGGEYKDSLASLMEE